MKRKDGNKHINKDYLRYGSKGFHSQKNFSRYHYDVMDKQDHQSLSMEQQFNKALEEGVEHDGFSHLVVGLGNPGAQNRLARHNVGQMMVDETVSNLNLRYKQVTTETDRGEERFNFAWYEPGVVSQEQKVGFIKSYRWINKIGRTIRAARDHVSIPNDLPERIVVVHDDITQPVGEYNIYQGKSAVSYNALSALRRNLESDDFVRIAIGVGQSSNPQDKDVTRQHVMTEMDLLDIVVLKEQVFPHILKEHIN